MNRQPTFTAPRYAATCSFNQPTYNPEDDIEIPEVVECVQCYEHFPEYDDNGDLSLDENNVCAVCLTLSKCCGEKIVNDHCSCCKDGC